ncbi:hypothetical protein C7N43_24350 [Sphingobacteriales bacterium UPWRP_1]|nr:hypothetical protein BVG80_16690 [Sphingobacteriales bacterium TSM_CSM]PSJ74388.1 hypothetical protein C7N43_24350 [Sphingobacteriales bacterium UPWRP_1]
MEIIHIILGKANPLRMNGVNKVVHELATRQTEAGMNVQVWGITANLAHDYPQRNFATRLFKASGNPFVPPAELKEALFEHRNRGVVHLHGGWIPVFYTISKWLKQYQIPAVFTPHGAYNIIAMQRSGRLKKLYFRFFEKELLQNVKVVHCLGKSEVGGLKSIYTNAVTQLIPYGFSCPDEQADSTVSPSHRPDFIIGFCGRIDIFTKGLDVLLEGFAAFKQRVPEAKLWVIGDGEEKARLQQLATSLKIFDDVIFWGSRFGNEKITLLKQCRVFAHPSRNEGLPASVLEAASLGLPCMVSAQTNVDDNVARYDAGYVLRQITAREINNGLTVLYNRICSNQAEPLQQHARQMMQEAYNWKPILNQFQQLYQNIYETHTGSALLPG